MAHRMSEPPDEPQEPQTCTPCHGSGQVISNLGEQRRKVTCPWCGGGGVRIAEADAQQWRREHDAES